MSSLTAEQKETTIDTTVNKLVCALPGSGKTHTSVSYTGNVLQADPANSVLLVTFTNASAAEMGDRLEKRLGQDANRTRSLTFASIMLKQFKPISMGRKLILGGEQQGYVRRALLQTGISLDNLDLFAEKIEIYGRELHFEPDGSVGSKAFIEYQNMLARFNRVDLNTVAKEVILGLRAGKVKPVPETHLVVDEFQDSDRLQFAWISYHANAGKVIFAVGDDDQSIYSWRGASGFENMVRLQEEHNAVGYVLSKCFRCSPKILAFAKRLIEHNHERIYKDMTSGRDIDGVVQLIAVPENYQSEYTKSRLSSDSGESFKKADKKKSDDEQKQEKELEPYRFVVDNLKDNSSGWAILSRTNSQLDLMEQALAERNIEVLRLGGKSIFDNEHAAGYIKLVAGLALPKSAGHLADGLGWLGENETTVHQIYTIAQTIGFGACTTLGQKGWTDTGVKLQAISAEWQTDTELDESVSKRMMKLNAVVSNRLEKIGDKKIKMQLAIIGVCTDIINKGRGSFKTRVQNLLMLVLKGKTKKVDHKNTEGVVLATMNSSKGLEFNKVWVINVDQGKMPLIKDDETDIAGKIEEERRLMYVAMTRAEDELRISYQQKKPSMFIGEILGYEPD